MKDYGRFQTKMFILNIAIWVVVAAALFYAFWPSNKISRNSLIKIPSGSLGHYVVISDEGKLVEKPVKILGFLKDYYAPGEDRVSSELLPSDKDDAGDRVFDSDEVYGAPVYVNDKLIGAISQPLPLYGETSIGLIMPIYLVNKALKVSDEPSKSLYTKFFKPGDKIAIAYLWGSGYFKGDVCTVTRSGGDKFLACGNYFDDIGFLRVPNAVLPVFGIDQHRYSENVTTRLFTNGFVGRVITDTNWSVGGEIGNFGEKDIPQIPIHIFIGSSINGRPLNQYYQIRIIKNSDANLNLILRNQVYEVFYSLFQCNDVYSKKEWHIESIQKITGGIKAVSDEDINLLLKRGWKIESEYNAKTNTLTVIEGADFKNLLDFNRGLMDAMVLSGRYFPNSERIIFTITAK